MGKKLGFSFSWKRASGLSALKSRASRRIGIPLTRAGRQRKVGKLMGCAVVIGAWLIAGAGSMFLAATRSEADDRKPAQMDGYGLVKWGATKHDVRMAYPRGGMTTGTVFVVPSTDVAGKPAALSFGFANDSLRSVSVFFTEKYANPNTYIEAFAEVERLLTLKYGPVKVSKELWTNDRSVYRNIPSQMGFAVAAGDVSMVRTWEIDATRISLACLGERLTPQVAIHYESLRPVETPRDEAADQANLKGL
jgi:hypothetical protein